MSNFEKELEQLINKHSLEGKEGGDTPDFILARYLLDCLRVFGYTTRQREQWFGRGPQPVETSPNDRARMNAALTPQDPTAIQRLADDPNVGFQ